MSESIGMDILEGYWDCSVIKNEDCDHGECVGYEIKELGVTIFTYENKPALISFHQDVSEVQS